jgi:hypothetical protein
MKKRILVALLAFCSFVGNVIAQNGLARNFREPPDSARPWVYWFWLNGNITREGITEDL